MILLYLVAAGVWVHAYIPSWLLMCSVSQLSCVGKSSLLWGIIR